MSLAFFSMGSSGCGDTKYYYVDSDASGSGSTNENNADTNDDINNNGGGSSGTAANIDGTWEIIDGEFRASYGTGVP